MRPPRTDRRTALLAAVAANGVPFVGVALWDWSVAVLVHLYWFELGVLLLFASVRALFAQRPAEFPKQQPIIGAFHDKYGGLPIPKTNLTIQVQSLVTLGVVPVLVVIWLFIGGVVFAGLGDSGDLSQAELSTLTLGVLALLVSNCYSTAGYFLRREYEDVNAQMVVRSLLWPILVTAVAGIFGATVVNEGGSTAVLLVGVVFVKFCFDLVAVYRDKLRAFDESQSLDIGWSYDPPEKPFVDETFDGSVTTVRPKPSAVFAGGIVRGSSGETVLFMVFIALCLAAVFAFESVGGAGFVVAVAGVVLCVGAALGIVDHSVRYLSMEYRIGVGKTGERSDIVGYDRILREPLWRIRGEHVADAEVKRGRVDRLLGTETVVLESDDRTVHLAHVSDTPIATD
ncbi:hypothetical protein AUR64_03095 [Haloprofundus marisrubri]|uniref:Uncharacterized protein n=1 Tax=Haloprofundus marisrubri TaxID=1514971 RepID=A0A0W1RDT1_9EURY|nr:DUF6498-containing protein [Haloprofundus marisrubri]KTG11607.1 hypothetical protein AUR64_03095 [Haloprofundus marisrubri]